MGNSKSIWKNPKFTTYACGTLFNSLGNAFFDLALPLLIYHRTNSLSLMGASVIFTQLPKIIMGPLIGTWVDRLNPRTILFTSYAIQFILVSLIPILEYLTLLNSMLVLVIGFLVNTANLFARSAQFSIIPLLYPTQKLEANAGFATVWTSSMITGPIIGGGLLTIFSPMSLIILNALSFIMMIFFLYLVRIPDKEKVIGQKKAFAKDLVEGLKIAMATRTLRIFLVSSFLLIFSVAPVSTLVIFYLKEVYLFEDSNIGFVVATSGTGLFLGTLVISKMKKGNLGNLIYIGFLCMLAGLTLLLLPGWWFIPISLFMISLGSIIYSISRNSIIQSYCPQEYLARVNSIFQLMEQIATPISITIIVGMASSGIHKSIFLTLVGICIAATMLFKFSKLNSKSINLEEVFLKKN
ncbi:MFS transporter [Lysinibacillus sp. NPDC047702]|uniref:MFS transporter n=1 Tax=unclassified Lysinibacillus TaxID=2636778 RepID=UPI003CFBF6B8